MFSPHQARRLRKLIRQFANAQEADSWKGGGDPEEMPLIEAEYKEAERRLNEYIRKLTKLKGRK